MTEAVKKTRSPKAQAAAKSEVKEKAPAVKKEAAPKKEAAAPKAKASPSGKTLRVKQMVGSIARQDVQRATLIGLGLNKRHRERVLQDTPEVRGMIYKVRHLVKVIGE